MPITAFFPVRHSGLIGLGEFVPRVDHIFAGLKVVDLASFLAGPGAATGSAIRTG
jgi:hypothetical protein